MTKTPVSAQDQASEAMEVLNELMESEVSIIIPHVADIVSFCLEVGAERLNSCFTSPFRVRNFILVYALTNNVYLRVGRVIHENF